MIWWYVKGRVGEWDVEEGKKSWGIWEEMVGN